MRSVAVWLLLLAPLVWPLMAALIPANRRARHERN